MGRFKHPRKVLKMDRTTEDVAVLLPPKIIEHYNDIYLDIEILYVNQTPFLLAISRNIEFIHCRPMSNNVWSKDCKKKILYGILFKAVNGTLLGAIIFYNKLSKHLIDHGFVQNKYDMCTFNKMMNSKQITVQFHVADLKVSHKEQVVLEDFLKDLRDKFGQEDELTENKGLIHECLGIRIDYSIPRKVEFTMFNYLEDVIVEASEDLKNSCSYYPGNDSL